MGSEGSEGTEKRRTVRRPQAGREPVCPACGQPVGTAIQRHKVLGAWVPVWRPRPCANPACALHADEARDRARDGTRDEPGKSTKTG
ncbi:hypothetical protein [Streptomyces sp. SP18CS02]|uniref:hypothetical protein n=1 Tax=Streptomyces sp. SP18CS02 TaxID=3002531 RepID=UPI002E7748F9|nr:hypothetical protein [Streptomyces sp. SP18CS02]MEE1757291.1 hypothetical protein [Streptomyces sp. SP18CS02]